MQAIFSSKETAQYLGMSESWLRQSRIKGSGPQFLKVGRSIRYRVEDLNTWLSEQVRQNTLSHLRKGA